MLERKRRGVVPCCVYVHCGCEVWSLRHCQGQTWQWNELFDQPPDVQRPLTDHKGLFEGRPGHIVPGRPAGRVDGTFVGPQQRRLRLGLAGGPFGRWQRRGQRAARQTFSDAVQGIVSASAAGRDVETKLVRWKSRKATGWVLPVPPSVNCTHMNTVQRGDEIDLFFNPLLIDLIDQVMINWSVLIFPENLHFTMKNMSETHHLTL